MLALGIKITEYIKMHYLSEIPKIVGEYDAADLHNRIAQAEAEQPDINSYDVLRMLAGGIKYPGIGDAVKIKYARFFKPAAFENYYADGQVDNIEFVTPGPRDTVVDSWHPDSSDNRLLVLPEFLTTASVWPTEFLIGRVAISRTALKRVGSFEYYYWVSEEGKDAIHTALNKGNAYVHKFEPGEVLKVPGGTLHRRNIPEVWSGYRYFMRRFPRFDTFRSSTNLGRMRPL